MNPQSGQNEGCRILEEFVCNAIPDPSVMHSNGTNCLPTMETDGQLVQEFHDESAGDAHKAFQDWRKLNPNGFFLNCRSSSRALLHRVKCRHPGDMEWEADPEAGSLTKHAKICSVNADVLRRWASDHGYAVSECNDCRP